MIESENIEVANGKTKTEYSSNFGVDYKVLYLLFMRFGMKIDERGCL